MSPRTAALVIVAVLCCAFAAAQEQEFTQGSLRVVPKPGEKLLEFPLKHTDVQADIAGMVAHVTVTQEYENPFDYPIEAVYVFPLPDNAAVNDMVMQIGDRTVRGLIQTREQARETYEKALAAGQRASLLEQERPNIFTQSVGNILPDDQIKIIIKYVETLSYVDGKYGYVFPMVVGPRFIPGSPMPTPASAGGWAPNTDRVPDASRITPPVLKPDIRTGHDISVTVRLNAGVPIRQLRSESHDVKITRRGPPEATVALRPHDTIPNKDFELEWEIAGDQPEIGLLTHHGETGGFFLMVVAPKGAPQADEITPKEMIFVQDCSGSMSGFPIEKSKEAMRRCIKGMNPRDTFQVIRFSEAASQFSPKPIPNTPGNVEKGLKYIDEMAGEGGTQMIEGIKAALNYDRDPERMRVVCFMTDGYIGNETEILAAIQERLGDARLFSFGVGTSVNRYLLDRMAEVGRGVVDYVNLNEDTEVVVNRFYERIRAPYLTDLAVDWGGLDAKDVYPQRIPDLFSAQPVLIYGRFDQPGSGAVELSGKLAGKSWSAKIDADFPKADSRPHG
jgi:Ca-activated chloride channel family protein